MYAKKKYKTTHKKYAKYIKKLIKKCMQIHNHLIHAPKVWSNAEYAQNFARKYEKISTRICIMITSTINDAIFHTKKVKIVSTCQCTVMENIQ